MLPQYLNNKRAFTLVEIMVVVGIIAILASLAIPAIVRSKMQANDTFAKKALKTLSTAAEWYSNQNSSTYPSDETALVNAAPPYLNQFFCTKTINGYSYGCTFQTSGYTLTATPTQIGSSGTTTFTIVTGGILTP